MRSKVYRDFLPASLVRAFCLCVAFVSIVIAGVSAWPGSSALAQTAQRDSETASEARAEEKALARDEKKIEAKAAAAVAASAAKSDDANNATGANSDDTSDDQAAAVVFKDKRLYVFNGARDGFSAKERAQRTTNAINQLARNGNFNPSLVRLKESSDGTEIVYGETFIATMTLDDAKRAQSSTQLLASEFAAKLRIALSPQDQAVTPYTIAFGVGIAIGATILLLISAGLLNRLGNYLNARIDQWNGTFISSVRIQQAELLSADSLCRILRILNRVGQLATLLAFVYIYLIVILNAFPSTQWLALALRDTALVPLTTAVEAVIGYLPKGIAIFVIIIVTYGVIAFADFFFNAVGAEQIRFTGFDPEWAEPTYQLVRVMIIAFALVASLPYAPFGESESFKQVGFLLGILVSLGSTAVIGNVMAGTVLTYTNAFKIGDRIKIGDCIGDVEAKSLFVTRLKTTNNEIVSIPNGTILNTNVTNFSVMGRAGLLIVHTQITIGYGEPWRKVHELLIAAALATECIVTEPEPFVLQRALSDFYVCYEINAYCNDAQKMNRVYSQMHANIQDKFNEAGVEIMSAHYGYLRDGNQTTIPANYLPKDYTAPAFVVKS